LGRPKIQHTKSTVAKQQQLHSNSGQVEHLFSVLVTSSSFVHFWGTSNSVFNFRELQTVPFQCE